MFSRVLSKFPKSQQARQFSVLNADASNSINKIFHKSNLAIAVLTPVAFLVPCEFSQPLDVTLGLILPFHSHVAMNYVITDYVPKSLRGAARVALLAATVVATAGLLKLNLAGPGITKSIKSLWCKPSDVPKKEGCKCPHKH